MIRQVLQALSYLHHNGICHRNVKAENIFIVDELNVKLADFGLASKQDCESMSTTVGTRLYMAPELLVSDSS